VEAEAQRRGVSPQAVSSHHRHGFGQPVGPHHGLLEVRAVASCSHVCGGRQADVGACVGRDSV
jgi:hypothetical protein